MATPPFAIDKTLPADSDLISQHPTAARNFRDVVESWLLTLSDTSGNIKGAALADAFAALGVAQPGMVQFTAAASAPAGWLLADGSAVSRTTYSDLFDEIGTTYGAGNGTTTFNLPDIRGRVIAGKGTGSRLNSGGVDGSVLGSTGGFDRHTLTTDQIPSHNHSNGSLSAESHSHATQTFGTRAWPQTGGTSTDGTRLSSANAAGTASNENIGDTGNSGTLNVSGSTSNTGGGESFNNTQPTIVLNAIIKT